MEYRQLGRCGLRVSSLTLGTMGFAGSGMFESVGQIDLAGRVGRPRNCLSAQALLLGFSDQGKQN